MTSVASPPAVSDLSYAQYSGWACCWCGMCLLNVTGVESAGIARGRQGAHVLDIEVYACSGCAARSSRRLFNREKE